MNLHGIVRGAIGTINPEILASLQRSNGYTTGPDFTQVASYAAAIPARIQVQALSGTDLKQIDLLNVQGVMRAVYLSGDWQGLVRADSKGGDLLTFGGHVWMVVQSLESWPDWSKVAVCQQLSP